MPLKCEHSQMKRLVRGSSKGKSPVLSNLSFKGNQVKPEKFIKYTPKCALKSTTKEDNRNFNGNNDGWGTVTVD